MLRLKRGENIFRKAALSLIIILLSICVTTSAIGATSKEGKPEKTGINSDKSKELKKTMEMYHLFLDGKIPVEYKGEWFNATTLGVPKGEPDKRGTVLYSYFDINGDGVPELILAFSSKYLYLSVKNGELIVWRFVTSSVPLFITKSGLHITQSWVGIVGAEETYHCYLLDYSGNELFDLNFSRYDCNQDGKFNEKDEYTYDGVSVSQEQWIQLTRKYLYTDNKGYENVKDKIEWKVFYKSLYY